jgi:hypothetical protein
MLVRAGSLVQLLGRGDLSLGASSMHDAPAHDAPADGAKRAATSRLLIDAASIRSLIRGWPGPELSMSPTILYGP